MVIPCTLAVSWSHLADAGSNGSLAGDPSTEYNVDLMRLTYHYNWFDGLGAGLPRARRAWGHVVNNLYDAWTGTAVLATDEARVLVEANRFEPRADLVAVDFRFSDQPNPKTRGEGNSSAGNVSPRENGTVPEPPYVFPTEAAGTGLTGRIRAGAGRPTIAFPGGQ